MRKSSSHGSLSALDEGTFHGPLRRRSQNGYTSQTPVSPFLAFNQMVSTASPQRGVSCSASMWAAAALPPLPPSFQQEIEFESTMHVSGLAAMQCEAKYGFMPGLTELPSAPSLDVKHDSSAIHHDGGHSIGTDFVSAPSLGESKSLAACLATPSEAVENEAHARLRLVASYNGIRGANSTVVFQFQEEVTNCVDRWGEWVRRIRRKRRMDHIQSVLSRLPSQPAILSK